MSLPAFLNMPFNYEFHEHGSRDFYSDVNDLYESKRSKKSLMVRDDGQIVRTNKIRVAWENFKGGFGKVNHCKKALVEYRILQLLDYGSKNKYLPFQEDRDKIELSFELDTKISPGMVNTYTDERTITGKYVKYYKFDLESHNVFAKIWHALKKKPEEILFDVSIDSETFTEELGEQFKKEEYTLEPVTAQGEVSSHIKDATPVQVQEQKTEEAAANEGESSPESKAKEKPSLEEETQATCSFMKVVGYTILATGGVAAAGVAATVLLPATAVVAPAAAVVAPAATSYSVTWITGAVIAAGGTTWMAKKLLNSSSDEQKIKEILDQHQSPKRITEKLTNKEAAKAYRQMQLLGATVKKVNENNPEFIKQSFPNLVNFMRTYEGPLKEFYSKDREKLQTIEEHSKAFREMEGASYSQTEKLLFEDLAEEPPNTEEILPEKLGNQYFQEINYLIEDIGDGLLPKRRLKTANDILPKIDEFLLKNKECKENWREELLSKRTLLKLEIEFAETREKSIKLLKSFKLIEGFVNQPAMVTNPLSTEIHSFLSEVEEVIKTIESPSLTKQAFRGALIMINDDLTKKYDQILKKTKEAT